MRICLIQVPNYHTEVAGFIIQHYIDCIIDVYHLNLSNSYNCFNYYSNLFNKTLNYVENIKFGIYNKIYFLTSHDVNKFNQVINYKERIIVIPHTPKSIIKEYVNIPLTPLINKHYCLPIYDVENNEERENILTIVGLTFNENKNINDLKYLANNCRDYQINIYTRKINENDINLYEELKKIKTIKFYFDLDTKSMIKNIRKSKYICLIDHEKSWYHRDRLTGMIPLGYNNEVPLILSQKLNDIYKLKGNITYNKSISEILEKVLIMSKEEYEELLYKMRICKKIITDKNRIILSQLN
jgi:DNA-directed RNA polymerase subunit H (RpoH/RPB5)